MLRIVVPARLGSSRLPGKMLAEIGGKPVVRHTLERVAQAIDAAGLELRLVLATDSQQIAAQAGGLADVVMTPSTCRTGTDRCAAAAEALGWPDEDIVVNVQADMPFADPIMLGGFFVKAGHGGAWDMLTAYAFQSLVEVSTSLDFDRIERRCHVGLYAYKRPALRRFAELASTPAEKQLRLEQRRAVDNGFRIGWHGVDAMPLEINTPADLAAARGIASCLA